MYGHFARIYDKFMEFIPYGQWADYLDNKFKENGVPRGGLVLDLACGTGTMASLMSRKGYEIIGVDASADMLSEAYSKCENVMFINQDMRELDLYGTVDAAYSTCDALNYMLTDDEFIQALANVALFLNPGGIFVFDLKTDNRYRKLGDKTYHDNKSGASYLWRNRYDPLTMVNEYRVQFFKNNRTFSELHRQRAYSAEAVRELTKKAGLLILSEEDNYTKSPAKENSERVTFTAKLIESEKF